MAAPKPTDILIAGIGDDTLFGDGGNDQLEGGFGNDIINGGDGDDIIEDSGGDDNIKAGDGNDVVHSGPGLDLVMGGAARTSYSSAPTRVRKCSPEKATTSSTATRTPNASWATRAMTGSRPAPSTARLATTSMKFSPRTASTATTSSSVIGGFDEFIAEGGDDIMVGSAGRGKMVGMSGFDWATYKDNSLAVDADLSAASSSTRIRSSDQRHPRCVRGCGGAFGHAVQRHADRLRCDRRGKTAFRTGGSEGYRGSRLTKEGIQLIAGLAGAWLTPAQVNAMAANQIVYTPARSSSAATAAIPSWAAPATTSSTATSGWTCRSVSTPWRKGQRIGDASGTAQQHDDAGRQHVQRHDQSGQLGIVRTIRTDTTAGDIDVAKYQGLRTDYTFGANAAGQVTITDIREDNLDGSDRLNRIERIQFTDNSQLGLIVGTPGNDVLNGTAGDDLILGLAGNDTLNGNAGNDVLVGGAGNDILNGGLGNDTYSFATGDGNDTIQEAGGTDRISIAVGATLTTLNFNEVVSLGTANDNLVIGYNGQQITVNDHFDTAGEAVETDQFQRQHLSTATCLTGDYVISADDTGDGTAVPV